MNRLSNRHIHGPVYAKPVKADGTKVTVKSHNVSTSEMKKWYENLQCQQVLIKKSTSKSIFGKEWDQEKKTRKTIIKKELRTRYM